MPHPGSPRPSLSFPPVLRRVWIAIAALTVVSVLLSVGVHAAHGPNSFSLGISPAGENFSDFTVYKFKFNYFHTPAFFQQGYPMTYPAPMALIYRLFFLLGDSDLGVFLAVSVLSVLVPAFLFARALVRRGVHRSTAFAFSATLLLCSWPAFVVIDRGNVEVFVWVTLAIGAWAFATGRNYTAAAFFALAASLKLFPFVLLGLFVSARRWRPLLFGVAVFAAATVASLAILGPTVATAYTGINGGLQFFHDTMMPFWRPWESGVDHSLLALFKFFAVIVFHYPVTTPFYAAATFYTRLMALVGIGLYVLLLRRLPLLNQLLAFSIICILFTPFSGDATLLHLYSAFALFCFLALDAHRRGLTVPGLSTALLLLAFITAYESFFVLPGFSFPVLGQSGPFTLSGQRFEGQAKCAALVWLLVVTLRYPFSSPLARTPSASPLAEPDASQIETAQPAPAPEATL